MAGPCKFCGREHGQADYSSITDHLSALDMRTSTTSEGHAGVQQRLKAVQAVAETLQALQKDILEGAVISTAKMLLEVSADPKTCALCAKSLSALVNHAHVARYAFRVYGGEPILMRALRHSFLFYSSLQHVRKDISSSN